MRSGSIYEVADVLKSLTFLAKSKSLSFREKRMLDRAKFLIISEVSEVMRETAPAIEGAGRSRARALLHDQGADHGRARKVVKAAPRAAAPRLRRAARAPLRHRRRKSTSRQSLAQSVRTPAGADKPQRAFSFMMRGRVLIAAVRSVATYVAVSLYVLVAGAVGMLLAIAVRLERPAVHLRARRRAAGPRALRGIRYRVAGAEHLPLDRAAVYCSNHQSNVDPPMLFTALHPRMHILYKARDRSRFRCSRARSAWAASFPIDRRNKEAAHAVDRGRRGVDSRRATRS